MPIMLAGMGQDMTARRGGRRDDGSSPEALDMSAAAAVVALTWIADVKAARNMGLQFITGCAEYSDRTGGRGRTTEGCHAIFARKPPRNKGVAPLYA